MTKISVWIWELFLVSVVGARNGKDNVPVQPLQIPDADSAVRNGGPDYTLPFPITGAGSAASNDDPNRAPPLHVMQPPLQKVLLNQVLALSAVLKKHGFTFWLDSGTALGAVRDGAIIPYDDDADMAVFIKDWNTTAGDKEYDRLLALNDELEDYTIVSTPPNEPHWNSFYSYKENENQTKFYAFSGPKGEDTGARCCIFIFRENEKHEIEQLYPFHRSVNSPDIVVSKYPKDWIFPLATATLGGQQVPVVAHTKGQFFVEAKATENSVWGNIDDVRPDRCYFEALNLWRPFMFFEERCATYCKCPDSDAWLIVAVLVFVLAIVSVLMALACRRLGSLKKP